MNEDSRRREKGKGRAVEEDQGGPVEGEEENDDLEAVAGQVRRRDQEFVKRRHRSQEQAHLASQSGRNEKG